MFEKLRRALARKRSGNFLSDLSWQGWCVLVGGCMMFTGIIYGFGIIASNIGIITEAGGFILGLILVIVGLAKSR